MLGLRTLIFDVTDLSKASAFYAQVLEKPPYFDQPFYVGFDVAGYELGLRPAETHRGAGSGTVYLGVTDVDREVERLLGLGATLVEKPEDVGDGIRVAVVHDPSGNALGLIENRHFAPPLVTAAAGDVAPRDLVHEAVVPLPRARVWELWSSTEGMKAWLVDDAKIELRPGGPYEVYFMMDAPAGQRGSETCRVLSFIHERMISFTWNAPPHLGRVRFRHTWVVVELEAASASETRVRITHTGWPSSGLVREPEWEAAHVYFDRAWGRVLESLASYAKSGKKA